MNGADKAAAAWLAHLSKNVEHMLCGQLVASSSKAVQLIDEGAILAQQFGRK